MLKAQNKWPISVCSWSLRASEIELPPIIESLGSPRVHLALNDLISTPDTAVELAEKLDISATMIGFSQEDYTTLETIKTTGGIVPDNSWEHNLTHVRAGIELTARLHVPFMTFHAGFISEDDPELFSKMVERITTIANIGAANGVTVLMETGQETADDLAAFVTKINHQNLGINFDPANMILYGKGDPIDALRKLAAWIKHIHIKDALKAEMPGEWGSEVAWGCGDVDTDAFVQTLNDIGYTGCLAVEREAGDDRIGDIKSAIKKLTTP
jgi:sugar phosphate isomerase/epimerase